MDDRNILEKKDGVGVDSFLMLHYTTLQYIALMYFTSKKRVLK